MEKYPMVATTLMGLEKVLAQEIEKLGGQKVECLKRAVSFVGDEQMLCTANLMLRTALRILVPIDHFVANNETELYDKIKRHPWEQYFGVNQTFAIETSISGVVFTHSQFVALKSKDAIVDRFREKFGKRPSIDRENPDIKINIHIHGNFAEISLDSSGISLDKRGYRENSNDAPINEVLAAGIILMSGWDLKKPFYDPMAGSGTFGIEAAMMATNTPPGINRKFAFENWNDFNVKLFEQIFDEAKSNIKTSNVEIFSMDLISENIDLIAQNTTNAGVEDTITLKREDFFVSKPKSETGILFLNPPYGERLKVSNANEFYSQIGDTLKQKYAGFQAWIISSNFESLKNIGLKADQKINLINGGLDAKLQQYSLY